MLLLAIHREKPRGPLCMDIISASRADRRGVI